MFREGGIFAELDSYHSLPFATLAPPSTSSCMSHRSTDFGVMVIYVVIHKQDGDLDSVCIGGFQKEQIWLRAQSGGSGSERRISGIKIQDSKSLAGDFESLNEMSCTVILSLDIRSYGAMIEKNKEKKPLPLRIALGACIKTGHPLCISPTINHLQ